MAVVVRAAGGGRGGRCRQGCGRLLSGKSQVTLHGQGEVRTLPLAVVESSRRGAPVEMADFLGSLR